jgi:transposase InsO family protein
VRNFVLNCPECQKQSQVKPHPPTQPFTVSSSGPNQIVAVDTIGNFPEDSEGFTTIISTIDLFHRYVTLRAAKGTSAEEAFNRSLLPLMGTFGPPRQLVSDGGTQFVNDLITQLSRAAGMYHHQTTPYSHQENSLVERYHKETRRHLSIMTHELVDRKQWRTLLPLVERIMNCSYLPAIGCSPASLVFGNAIDPDQGIFIPFSAAEATEINLGDYMKTLVDAQSQLIRTAQRLLQEHADSHTDGLIEVQAFAPGKYVLVSHAPGGLKNTPTKLDLNWKGPYVIVRNEGDSYFIRNLVTSRIAKVHVTRLKEFRYDPNQTSPLDIARRDFEEFFVEEVLEHRGDFKQKRQLTFKVRWLGYGPEADTWEPWSGLKDVLALHRYLHKIKMDKYIPKEHVRDQYLTPDVNDVVDLI